VWAVRDGLLLRGAVYRSFRAPTVNELYRPFRVRNDITAANSALAAERLTGAELGIDQRGRRGGLRLTAFWNRIDDPVANVTVGSGPGAVEPCGFVPAGGVCRQRDNLGVIEVKGIEGGVEFEPEGGWRLSLSALVERSEVAEAPRQPELVGRKVAQVPDWQVVAGISRGSGPLGGAVQIRWVAAQFEDDLNEIRLDPYALVDVGLDFQCSERVRLFVKAENLLDESFSVAETADGIVSIGSPRLVRLGVRLRRSGAR
jgi:outer membrane receptor protein involved in Fe transport